MAKTANNSFGSDKSGIVIWKHNTMGHMDNGVEEQIARLVKKQQEGLVDSTALLSFASESGVVDKPKRGFLKRFFGKKEASASAAPSSSSLPALMAVDTTGSSLVIQDKSSSFETTRSRASSQEDVRSGKTELRVFRDGKGAAVVALADGRNFPDLAQRAREAGFPDLARQIETAVPRQPRAVTRASRVKSTSQPTASEIIDRVRARNQERLGRSGSGTSEAERHGEISIRSVEDLRAHRAELAKHRSQLASLRQKESGARVSEAKPVEDAPRRPTRKDNAEQTEPLERSALVSAWLQSGNITGNPVLYPDTSPDAPGVPTSLPPPFSHDVPPPNGLLEADDRRLFPSKSVEDPSVSGAGHRYWGEGGGSGEGERALGPNNDSGQTEGPLKRKASPVVTRSPLSKASALQFHGAQTGMLRSVSDRPPPPDPLDVSKALARANSEIVGLMLPKHSPDPALESEAGVGRARVSDGHRSSLRGERGSALPSPDPAPAVVRTGGSPGIGILVSPVKGLPLDPKRAPPVSLAWSPLDALLPLNDVPSPKALRPSSGKAEEGGSGGEGERYDPAQWHKYLQERSAQVLPHLAAEAVEEVLHGARATPPPNDAPQHIRALPLPLPPDLHRLPASLGPPNWAYKASEANPYEFDASGGATPRSSASCLTEPHSPSSPLRDLLLSPHAHTVEAWHATSTYSG